jgi:hypothetical protein
MKTVSHRLKLNIRCIEQNSGLASQEPFSTRFLLLMGDSKTFELQGLQGSLKKSQGGKKQQRIT